MDDRQVTFRYKDYRANGVEKTLTLAADEFIRRFLLHVLPDGFQRIRYFGFLGNRHRQAQLARCRALLGMALASPHEARPTDSGDHVEALINCVRVSPHLDPNNARHGAIAKVRLASRAELHARVRTRNRRSARSLLAAPRPSRTPLDHAAAAPPRSVLPATLAFNPHSDTGVAV
jgi:hypothetical protein